MAISYEKIPNNVDLSSNRKLQKALEEWQPNFLEWWGDMGPEGFQQDEIYLRTAVSVEPSGWAHFDYVRMPEYRWGIFLTPRNQQKKIHFGDNIGKDAWDDVPGEFRKELRRIIVTQGDTEPASVEQQKLLGHTCPSLYDLRNLFQVNVEEGRHLWAMVHLLHQFFGRDGREEAEEMLQRRSGDPDTPRILGAFNKPCRDWLSFFCFTMFTDRDGKYQLAALAESSFDPLARATQFMLTEEAHHLFVGETGVGRVVERTARLIRESPAEDVRERGGIPPRHDPKVDQRVVLRVARPVRRRGFLERSQLLRRRPQGALRRVERQALPGSRGARGLVRARRSGRDEDDATGDPPPPRDEPRPPRLLLRRLRTGAQEVESDARERWALRPPVPALSALQPPDRALCRHALRHARSPPLSRGLHASPGRVPPDRRGPGLRGVADAARARAREDRRMDRTAAGRESTASPSTSNTSSSRAAETERCPST